METFRRGSVDSEARVTTGRDLDSSRPSNGDLLLALS
jgi:hypothetical protein